MFKLNYRGCAPPWNHIPQTLGLRKPNMVYIYIYTRLDLSIYFDSEKDQQ